MTTKPKCECRFSVVEPLSDAEKRRYVDKTRCRDCGKVTRIKIPGTPDDPAEAAEAAREAAEDGGDGGDGDDPPVD